MTALLSTVIPAQAGIQSGYVLPCKLDSRFRGNDAMWEV